jgi:hypothetical protein
MEPWLLVTVAAVGAWLLSIVVYVLVLRPWHMTLGCTAEEAHRHLAGDDLLPTPSLQATHAITIRAPAAEIWPWLIQMGQGRAGFYSYDWLEQLFGCAIENAGEIVPSLQTMKVGDGISLHPKSPPLTVAEVQPHRAIVLAGGPELQPGMPRDRSWYRFHTYQGYTWTFTLDEQPDGTTRLIARIRVAWNKHRFGHFFRSRVFLEPVHTIMQRKMNRGIKERVERRLG